jgi:predicted GNAT family N-acyltransferase
MTNNLTFQPLPIQAHNALRHSGVSLASTRQELDALRRLRYEVYVEEEGKTLASANHETRQLCDSCDENAIHLYIAEAGEVVACVRVHAGVIPESLAEHLELGKFPDARQGHDCFISKLMVRRDHRGSMAAVRLMRAIYTIAEQLGIAMVFCTTFPHLVALYQRIGLEPCGDMYEDRDFGAHYALAARLRGLAFHSGKASRLPKAA